jgi:hypothetical protein
MEAVLLVVATALTGCVLRLLLDDYRKRRAFQKKLRWLEAQRNWRRVWS